jgi:hypothetical protein
VYRGAALFSIAVDLDSGRTSEMNILELSGPILDFCIFPDSHFVWITLDQNHPDARAGSDGAQSMVVIVQVLPDRKVRTLFFFSLFLKFKFHILLL